MKGLGALVVLGDEAVDGGLQVDDGVEDAVLQAAAGELGEETLNRVQPGAGGGREVEGPARMAIEPRGGSVCLNTVRGVSKWLCRAFQAAAGIGVAMLMYAWLGVFPPSEEWGLLPL